jgi:anti-sigma factor RsiW
MKCEKLRQEYMEAVVCGPDAISVEAQEHMRSCSDCSRELASFAETMALLDEWQTPEPSPYFNSRLQARLREEIATAPARSWLAWLRRPIAAAVAAVLLALGVSLLEMNRFTDQNTLANNDSGVVRVSAPGTPVGDLQYLDKNADLFSEFDVLDGQSSTE